MLRLALSAPHPAGREGEIVKAFLALLSPAADCRLTPHGSLVATAGEGAPHLALEAHIDQIGFVVTHWEDGFCKIAPVGGVDSRLLPAERLRFLTDPPVYGVVCSTPPHLQKGEDKPREIADLWVDLPSPVPPGTFAVADSAPVFLENGRVMAPGLDNAVGVAAATAAFLSVARGAPRHKISLVLAAQEEVGGRGAAGAVYDLEADEVVVLDASFGAAAGLGPHESKEMGKGPMIGVAASLTPEISDRLRQIAEAQGIPFQIEVMAGRTGTDADRIGLSQGGVATGLVSIPLRYMHSQNELIDLGDVEATARLLLAYLEEGGTAK